MHRLAAGYKEALRALLGYGYSVWGLLSMGTTQPYGKTSQDRFFSKAVLHGIVFFRNVNLYPELEDSPIASSGNPLRIRCVYSTLAEPYSCRV